MPPKCVAFLFVHFGVSSIDSQRPQTKEQATAAQWGLIYFETFGMCFLGEMKFFFSRAFLSNEDLRMKAQMFS